MERKLSKTTATLFKKKYLAKTKESWENCEFHIANITLESHNRYQRKN